MRSSRLAALLLLCCSSSPLGLRRARLQLPQAHRAQVPTAAQPRLRVSRDETWEHPSPRGRVRHSKEEHCPDPLCLRCLALASHGTQMGMKNALHPSSPLIRSIAMSRAAVMGKGLAGSFPFILSLLLYPALGRTLSLRRMAQSSYNHLSFCRVVHSPLPLRAAATRCDGAHSLPLLYARLPRILCGSCSLAAPPHDPQRGLKA